MLERKKRKPDKTHVARKPDEVANYKKRFLEQLKKGCPPGVAARNVNIARCTAYNWRTADREFDAAWIDAVETALDRLETKLYDSAMKGNFKNARFILQNRRYNKPRGRPQQSNFCSSITLEEQLKRIERLGLPVPVIETDYDIDDCDDVPAGHP
jgi:hypothetical protein